MGRAQINSLYHQKNKCTSREHGAIHSLRVLFLAHAIIQAGKIKLNARERKQLRTAISYHDIGRTNDREDAEHGTASRSIYERHSSDPTVGFLIQYHCLDDQLAESALYKEGHISSKKRVWLLYQILKDADALDRVRFGIQHLDINCLRLPISHKLVPLAVAALRGRTEHIKELHT